MTEPTRQQIKEAFKETIKRWEKIVEEPSYYHESDCQMCRLFSPGDMNCAADLCPIAIYVDDETCRNTPYATFCHNKTSANALAELSFLREVYIWWVEEEEKDKKWEGLTGYVKEEKKEEWVDIKAELTACIVSLPDGFLINIFHNDLNVAFIDGSGIYLRPESRAYADYKVKLADDEFCILKKS